MIVEWNNRKNGLNFYAKHAINKCWKTYKVIARFCPFPFGNLYFCSDTICCIFNWNSKNNFKWRWSGFLQINLDFEIVWIIFNYFLMQKQKVLASASRFLSIIFFIVISLNIGSSQNVYIHIQEMRQASHSVQSKVLAKAINQSIYDWKF